MNLQETVAAIRRLLDYELFPLGGSWVTVGTVLATLAIVGLTLWASWLARHAAARFLGSRGIRDEGTIGATKRLLHYLVLLVGFGLAVHTLGLDLSTLFAAGALFAVGIGFAMQNITANFVSGIILLGERAIKPGDVLDINGEMVRVKDMGIRATVVRTLNDENVIIPNSDIVQSAVKNYTFRDTELRLRVQVGVSYDSDMHRVREVLERCASGLPWKSGTHEPIVLLTDFGSSSVDWEVSVWIDDPWKARRSSSALREAIWWALKDAAITIAYPQLDLHLDRPALEALRGGRAVA